ncbi:hypothetical protein V5799_011598 [Amblyomma americanum]|uniref:Acyl-coa synthetase n=1 Tax=Amblyomma americanum TaxID=6943 RepID=A0AAQ4EGE8_AMBAM
MCAKVNEETIPGEEKSCGVRHANRTLDLVDIQKAAEMSVTIDAGVVRHQIQDMDIPEVDFGTFLWETCSHYGDRIAVTEQDGASCSYTQLRERWLRVAAGLQRRGFGPDQLACVHAANSGDLLLAVGGTFLAGGGIVFSKAVMTPNAFESVDKVFIGGSTAPAALLKEAQVKFSFKFISQGYGLTETCGSVTSTGLKDCGFGSVGKPVPMVQVKVVDSKTGRKLGPGEKGEICVKAPFTFMGYVNKARETAEVYDDEGFVQTGDVGFYDERGDLYVTGRLKELIKCMDLQIEPAEIERLLLQDPAVCEALVAGVPHEQFGEAVRAFVVLSQGRAPDENTRERLRRTVAEALPNHEHLHGGVEFVDHIPKSETGKSIRAVLRDAYLQGQVSIRQ